MSNLHHLCWWLRLAGHAAAAVEVGETAIELYRVKHPVKDGVAPENTLWVTELLVEAYDANSQAAEKQALIKETIALLEQNAPDDTKLIETWRAKLPE